MDYATKIENNNGKYRTDKPTLNQIGVDESRGFDYSKLQKTTQSSRISTEGGTSNVYRYNDSQGTKFVIHEVTDASGNLLHRDFDAVRIASGQTILPPIK